ncbi:unknown [Anaerotruncus sp. CAG:390]|nr:unknown [Anaerotruncus sp. CAG:390]
MRAPVSLFSDAEAMLSGAGSVLVSSDCLRYPFDEVVRSSVTVTPEGSEPV